MLPKTTPLDLRFIVENVANTFPERKVPSVTSQLPNGTSNPYLGSACHLQPDPSFFQRIWWHIEQLSVSATLFPYALLTCCM